MLKVLVIGATGSVGRLVVEEAVRAGHSVRAMARAPSWTKRPADGVEFVSGDVTKPETLVLALDDIDAVILTVNADGQGKTGAEAVYYEGVRDLILAIGARPVHVALMTTIGVTERQGHYNRTNEGHDWKRRAERFLRASGLPYTIVRPGWFDYNTADQHRLIFLQGDRRHSGTPSDGVIDRRQIAEVLVASLTSPGANRKTFELVAEQGPAQTQLDPLFQAAVPDAKDALDAVSDLDNMPLSSEPERVRKELSRLVERKPSKNIASDHHSKRAHS